MLEPATWPAQLPCPVMVSEVQIEPLQQESNMGTCCAGSAFVILPLPRRQQLSKRTAKPANGYESCCENKGGPWPKGLIQEASRQPPQAQSHSHVQPLLTSHAAVM